MKKDKDKKEEEVVSEEHPRVDTGRFYTPEVLERMRNMSKSEMESLLKGLIDSPAWIAIIKYHAERISLLDSVLREANPYVHTYEIALAQGRMQGLSDLEIAVMTLNKPKE